MMNTFSVYGIPTSITIYSNFNFQLRDITSLLIEYYNIINDKKT